MMDDLKAQFAGWLGSIGISLSDEQWDRFEEYYRLLVDWNERMNLTAIVDREQVYVKHFFDSATLAVCVPPDSVTTLADIGTGAGFPGVPLKILFPHLRLTLIDSLQKRIVFLRHLVDRLALSGVDCFHGRAEELARKSEFRDRFDLVTARAVARLNVLNELCLPFVRQGGTFAAMKGANAEAELAEAERSFRELHASLIRVHRFQLPREAGERGIILIKKQSRTPSRYPRKPGEAARNPIV